MPARSSGSASASNSSGAEGASSFPVTSGSANSASSGTSHRPSQRNPFRSLLSTAPPGEDMPEVRLLPLDLIDPNPYQSRQAFDPGSLEELASSIREHGVIEPIVVRRAGERYEIVAGERRHRASTLAEQEMIPARIMDLDPESAAIITAIENLQREDLDIEDEARQFAYLLQVTGLSQRKLAARLGVQFNYLSRRVRLLKRPDLMEEYRSGRKTLHQVIELLDSGTGAGEAGDVEGAEGITTPLGSGDGETGEGSSVSAGYSPGKDDGEDAVSRGYSVGEAGEEGTGEGELELIEREDLPGYGFIVSRGYSGSSAQAGRGSGTASREGRQGGSGRRGGMRFRWRPVQQFYNWVGRTHVEDVPADERTTLKVQLTEIKEALEKQIAELEQLEVSPTAGPIPASAVSDASDASDGSDNPKSLDISSVPESLGSSGSAVASRPPAALRSEDGGNVHSSEHARTAGSEE